jgi:uncharacterized membrane protein YgdD (TMEM256/DUF423 family)
MAAMWLFVAALLGFVAVAAGAFGAHALGPHLGPRELDVWKTAAHYHLVHAVLLGAISLPGAALAGRCAGVARCCLVLGMVLFSGTLYAYVLSGQRWLAMITPVGGISLMAGWVAIAVAALARRRSSPPMG